MTKKSYFEYLKDPQWQKKRLEILQRDEFMCCICSDGKTELHVHHKRYKRGAKPWEYDNENLVTLCEKCHSSVTSLVTDIQSVVDFEPTRCAFSELLALSKSPVWVEVFDIIHCLARNPDLANSFYKITHHINVSDHKLEDANATKIS